MPNPETPRCPTIIDRQCTRKAGHKGICRYETSDQAPADLCGRCNHLRKWHHTACSVGRINIPLSTGGSEWCACVGFIEPGDPPAAEPECVCHETSSRNCPVHADAAVPEPGAYEAPTPCDDYRQGDAADGVCVCGAAKFRHEQVAPTAPTESSPPKPLAWIAGQLEGFADGVDLDHYDPERLASALRDTAKEIRRHA